MAIPHRSHHGDDGRPLQPARYRRRRRPSLWDVKTPTYQVTAPAAPPPRPGRPSDVVHPPAPGETGPLAGIDVSALLRLLRPPSAAGRIPPSSSGPSQHQHPGGNAASTPTSDLVHNVTANPGSEAVLHATRHARRLYVGNLPADTTELQIGDFFNRALVAAKGSESGEEPVISVYINLEKRFAFIETHTVRESAAGLCLDGVKFRNVSLRVRRPNDFIPNDILAIKPPAEFNPSVLGIVSTQVSDGPNKMFIGGIPYTLNEDEVKNILKSFGDLKAFNLIKEPTTGLSKGFAFFEYADSSVVEQACNALHGTPVGDKTLTVRRATQSSSSATASAGQPSGPKDLNAAKNATFASGLARHGNGAQALALAKVEDLIFPSATVVRLAAVVNDNDLRDDTRFADTCADIEQEAKSFGKLLRLVAPRPSGDRSDVDYAGDVFLKFATPEEAESAQICLHGRKFDDKPVTAEFFDEKLFDSKLLKT